VEEILQMFESLRPIPDDLRLPDLARAKTPRPLEREVIPDASQIWLEKHPVRAQPLAQFILSNTIRISQSQFESTLLEGVRSFNTAIADRPFGVIHPQNLTEQLHDPDFSSFSKCVGSGDWVKCLALEHGLQHPLYHCSGYDHKHLIANDCYDLLVIDDMSISGGQLIDLLYEESDFCARGGTVHILVPYLTNLALNELRGLSLRMVIHKYETIPLLSEIIETEETKRVINSLLRKFFPGFARDSILTFFDHMVPDNNLSFNDYDDGGDTVWNIMDGFVPCAGSKELKGYPQQQPWIMGHDQPKVYQTPEFFEYWKSVILSY
jgi:hypothetical protein